jgi:hypothetical protein
MDRISRLRPVSNPYRHRHPRGPAELQEAAFWLNTSARDLLVLSPDADPYNSGTPAHRRDAEWFRTVWDQFGYDATGAHLRRIHYRLFVTGGDTSTGETYENTESHWEKLQEASRHARYLQLVDAERFVDRRNREAILNVAGRILGDVAEPSVDFAFDGWDLPWISPNIYETGLLIPPLRVYGYGYVPVDQPVLQYVWIEKSTMDDILGPLCQELSANLITGEGFTSITRVIEILREAEKYHAQRVHLHLISDFDNAGVVMPLQVARQAQFWADALGIDVEVTADYLGLTRAQVEKYELPRKPAREGDMRTPYFEEKYGEGVVELDALEALRPGELARIVRTAIEEWKGADLEGALEEAQDGAQRLADTEWARAQEEIRRRRDELATEVGAVVAGYRERLADLSAALAADLEPFRQRLENLETDLSAAANELVSELDLPDRPEGVEPDVDRDDLLYDSARPWQAQLEQFKTVKAGGAS